MIMGHSHPDIVNAIKKQAELGTSYGAPTSLESDVASLIVKNVPSIEKIRMVNSGTEATMSCYSMWLEGATQQRQDNRKVYMAAIMVMLTHLSSKSWLRSIYVWSPRFAWNSKSLLQNIPSLVLIMILKLL